MQEAQSTLRKRETLTGDRHRQAPQGMSLRSWPEQDINPEALAFAVRETVGKSRISRNRMIAEAEDIDKGDLDRSLDLLTKLGIIQRCADNQRYHEEAPRGNSNRDFLAVSLQKKVRVSSEGHRSVSLRGFLMALRNEVVERKCGSFVWREQMPAPKYSLLLPKRWNPISGNNHDYVSLRMEKQKQNDMMFKLRFDPPLSPGEFVSYGFYIWNKNHYSRSRKEALERYKDEWIREGLAILDPALQARITVELPEGYKHQRAKVEKDPVLTMGGPNIPGTLVRDLDDSQRILDLELNRPSAGHYFVSWIPPD
jgi:hypothetical protein